MYYKEPTKMTTQEIQRELNNFAWEYIALSDRVQTDSQYADGEKKLDERKAALTTELKNREVSWTADDTWGCPMCDAEFPGFMLRCPCGYPRPVRYVSAHQ